MNFSFGMIKSIEWNLDAKSRAVMGAKWCADKDARQLLRRNSQYMKKVGTVQFLEELKNRLALKTATPDTDIIAGPGETDQSWKEQVDAATDRV